MKNQDYSSQVSELIGSIKYYKSLNVSKIAIFAISSLISFTGFSQVNDFSITQEKLKRGIYKTYEEFKNNDPISTDSFYVELKERKRKNWRGTSSTTPRYTKNDRKIKNVWGFCDGTIIYVYHQKEFFPIELHDAKIVFCGYEDLKNKSSAGGEIMIGGANLAPDPYGLIVAVPTLLVGGIVAAVIASSHKKHKIKYSINLRNGMPEYYTSN